MRKLIDKAYLIYLILSMPEVSQSPVRTGRKQAKEVKNACKVISRQIHTINKTRKLREIKNKRYRV